MNSRHQNVLRKPASNGHALTGDERKPRMLRPLIVGSCGKWASNVYAPAFDLVRLWREHRNHVQPFALPTLLDVREKPVGLQPGAIYARWDELGEEPYDVILLTVVHWEQLRIALDLEARGLIGPATTLIMQKPLSEPRQDAQAFVQLAARTGCTAGVHDHWMSKIINHPYFSFHRPDSVKKITAHALEQQQINDAQRVAHDSPRAILNWLASHVVGSTFPLAGQITKFDLGKEKPKVLKPDWTSQVFGRPVAAYVEFDGRVTTTTGLSYELVCRAGKGQARDHKSFEIEYWDTPVKLELDLMLSPLTQVDHMAIFLDDLAENHVQAQQVMQPLDTASTIVNILQDIHEATF